MRLRPVRTTRRTSSVVVAAVLAVAVMLSGTGASAQNVESLRNRAARLADELEQLERKASELDEEYLQLEEELAELESERSEKKAAVAEAREAVEAARREAAGYVVEAYIGAGSSGELLLQSSDVNVAVNQRTLLEIVRGDKELVADELDVRRQDLDARVSELERAEQRLAERRERQEAVVADIRASVERHRELLEGANAELRDAIEAERRRREAAAAAAAAARAAEQARAAERRAAAESTTSTTAQERRGRRSSTTEPPAPAPRRNAPAPTPPAPAPPPVSAPNSRAAGAIAAARSVLGTPYRWAGSSPSTGFDCSGLLVWAWAQVGVSLPRTSRSMYASTQRISESQLQPGDLVFYGNPVYHVGMYVGGGQMIHSPRTGDVVKIAPIHRGFGNPVGYGRIR